MFRGRLVSLTDAIKLAEEYDEAVFTVDEELWLATELLRAHAMHYWPPDELQKDVEYYTSLREVVGEEWENCESSGNITKIATKEDFHRWLQGEFRDADEQLPLGVVYDGYKYFHLLGDLDLVWRQRIGDNLWYHRAYNTEEADFSKNQTSRKIEQLPLQLGLNFPETLPPFDENSTLQ